MNFGWCVKSFILLVPGDHAPFSEILRLTGVCLYENPRCMANSGSIGIRMKGSTNRVPDGVSASTSSDVDIDAHALTAAKHLGNSSTGTTRWC